MNLDHFHTHATLHAILSLWFLLFAWGCTTFSVGYVKNVVFLIIASLGRKQHIFCPEQFSYFYRNWNLFSHIFLSDIYELEDPERSSPGKCKLSIEQCCLLTQMILLWYHTGQMTRLITPYYRCKCTNCQFFYNIRRQGHTAIWVLWLKYKPWRVAIHQPSWHDFDSLCYGF